MARIKHPEDVRLKLLETGLTLFSHQGYNGTGIKEIADAANMPKGSFYNYFASKEEFGAATIQYYGELVASAWAEYFVDAPREPLAALRHGVAKMVSYHEQCEVKCGCLFGNFAAELAESSDACRLALRGVVGAWRAHFADHLRRAQAEGAVRTDITAEALADFFWNAWEGALLRMKIEHSIAPLRACVDLMFDRFFVPHA